MTLSRREGKRRDRQGEMDIEMSKHKAAGTLARSGTGRFPV